MEATCWICGSEADSSEHVFKKTDLIRAYGKGPYRGPSGIAHVREGVQRLVQGPNSKNVKYKRILCRSCNTTFSQPFDKAYDTFVRWLDQNDDIVLNRRFVDFADVYGSEFEVAQRNLYKYFAKAFGCRIINSGFKVPSDVVKLLGRDTFRTALRLTFAVNEDILIMPQFDRRGFIGKGDLIAWAPRSEPTRPSGFTWDEHISWLTVCYWYNEPPDGRFGSTWIADSQFLYLGSFAPLNPQMRAELKKKASRRSPG
jgi:hypothetical protein